MDALLRRRKDPQPPVKMREKVRLLLLVLGFAAGWRVIFVMEKQAPGAAFQRGFGIWLATWGLIDLFWLWRWDTDRVWLRSPTHAILAAAARVVGGAALIWVSF